jgi:hypothetical protein
MIRAIPGPGRQPCVPELLMAMKTQNVTRPRMGGTAMKARTVGVSPPVGQTRLRRVQPIVVTA